MTSAAADDGAEHERSVTWAQRKLWGVYGVPTPGAPRLSVASEDEIDTHRGRPQRWVLDLVRQPSADGVIEFELGFELEADLDEPAPSADEDVTWILAHIADVDLG